MKKRGYIERPAILSDGHRQVKATVRIPNDQSPRLLAVDPLMLKIDTGTLIYLMSRMGK